MALNQYLTDTELLLNDPNNLFFSTNSLTNWINQARNRIAEVSQCLPVLIPGAGSILTIAVANGGSGYGVAPTVTISAPDASGTVVQATATATVSGGQVTAITVVNSGSGYVATPTVTLSGGGYSVAATPGAVTLTPYVATVAGQETYPLNAAPISTTVLNQPGYQRAIGVQSISVSWGSMKPTLDFVPFTTFQAQYRAYNIGNQNYPSVWTRLGRGASQVIYLWPVPGQASQMEIVAYCQPVPLVTDATYEAIPEPFTSAVKYYAAYLAYMNAQRKDDANWMASLYKERMIECGVADTPSYSPSAYDGD